MAEIVGYDHISLSVTDLARSVAWYVSVLNLEEVAEVKGPSFQRKRLSAADGAVILALTQHDDESPDAFSELQAGVDHIAFQLGSADDLQSLKTQFERLEVTHSEVKEPYPGNTMITLRDPDNIQLEVWARRPDEEDNLP